MPDTATDIVELPTTIPEVLRNIATDIETRGFYTSALGEQGVKLYAPFGEDSLRAGPDGCCCIEYNPTLTGLRRRRNTSALPWLPSATEDYIIDRIGNIAIIGWNDEHTAEEVTSALRQWADEYERDHPDA